ncbi:MAG: hypothetical protein H6Q69_306 [Firmicutes bacterium]|nr:hypothetical protein [Bacillota bacterium]
MKCMPGVTTVTTCRDCGVQGVKTGFSSPMVLMKCPRCGREWKTLSAMCKRCHNPSGSPYMSDCPVCVRKALAGKAG